MKDCLWAKTDPRAHMGPSHEASHNDHHPSSCLWALLIPSLSPYFWIFCSGEMGTFHFSPTPKSNPDTVSAGQTLQEFLGDGGHARLRAWAR